MWFHGEIRFFIPQILLNSRLIFDLMSCATQKIRSLGADCDLSSSYTGDLVHKFLMENVQNGDQLPQESTQIMIYCAGKIRHKKTQIHFLFNCSKTCLCGHLSQRSNLH